MYTTLPLCSTRQSVSFILIIMLLAACGLNSKKVSPTEEVSALVADTLTEEPSDAPPESPEIEEATPPAEPDLPAYSANQNLLSKEVDSTENYQVMVFEEEIEDDFAENKTNIRFYRREGTTGWVSIDSVILFEEGRKCFSISPVTFLPLGELSGFFIETEAGRYGTANAGLTERDYIFFVPGAESASVYRYAKWVQLEEGELKIISKESGDFGRYVEKRISDSK